MLEAAKKYDVNSDTKFSTYAYSVMRNAMSDLCRKCDSSFERQFADNGIVQIFLNDDPVDEDGTPVCEKFSDGRARDPVGDEAVLRVTIQKKHNRLEMLPAREQRILMYHYGLSTLVFKTISETAAFFHLTENYLRAIENHALAKLKDGMNDGKIV